MSDERAETIVLANKLMEQPWCDPDDDLRTLSRQFLRGEERIAALAAETTAYVDKLVAEKREMEAALTKVHGIVAEYWGPCPGSVETLLTIRDVLGTKNWRPNVDFMPRLLTPSETKGDAGV